MGWGWKERGREEEEDRGGAERELGGACDMRRGKGERKASLIEFFRAAKTRTREVRTLPLSSFRIMSMS